ncbi:MAG TPA: hypothetical protein VJ653_02380 [Acidimicrobiales bacterium]|nr:hypothetical protein [Acidimicrobiales bacterium]
MLRRRLVLAALAAILLAACDSGGDDASTTTTFPFFDTTSTSALPTTPVVGRVLSPAPASVQGRAGRGMVVFLQFTARDATVLPAEFRLGGALPPPAPAARPGRNPAFPGLVVGMSTTGTALGGPSANLANLFQLVSPASQLDGSVQVSAIWSNSTADFGTDIDATLVAYVVSGTAPDTIPETQANIDVISNTVEVNFRIGSGVGAPTTAVGAATTTSTVRGATTTSVRPTSTTARATTTTARPTTTLAPTTTVAPTTSTTKFLGIF